MENKFGFNLRFLRKKQRLTLVSLAEVLAISKSAVADYEVGKTIPPLDVCQKIAQTLGVSIKDLQEGNFAALTEVQLSELLESRKEDNSEADFSNTNKQLAFQNRLLLQQIDGLKIQLQLVRQIVGSKESEIRSLKTQVVLLEEKLKD